MAVRVKLLQNNVKSSPNYGKYYAKAIPQGEVTLEQLMKEDDFNDTIKTFCKILFNIIYWYYH